MVADLGKAAGAFRTIGEVARDTGLPQHILRYWETRFPQLRPLQRSGRRRYYRPDDVVLVNRINALLNQDGYTIRGVQKLLASEGRVATPEAPAPVAADFDPGALSAIRSMLVRALSDS